mgnify:CR=1 FL=1
MTAIPMEKPSVPLGKIKSFGAFGPKYQVGELLRPTEERDWMVRITLLDSGEETEYRYSRLIEDPEGV